MFRSRGEKIFGVFNYILLTIISITCLLPLLNVLAISLSSTAAASAGRVSIFPVDLNISAYKLIVQKPLFASTILNSLKRVLIGVPVNMLLTITAGYAMSMSKEKLAYRQFYVWFFMIPMLISGGLIPTYLTIRAVGLLNSFWSLILPGAVPIYNIILMMNFFRGLPSEMEEAARIDGAGYWRILWRIAIPCSLPAIATLVLFCFVSHWNEWFSAQIYLNDMKQYPLQSYLQIILNQTKESNMALLSPKELEELARIDARTQNAAQIVVSTIPILMVYPFLQKYFVKGLTLGGVKG